MLSGILNSIATRYQVAQTHETSYEATLTNPIIYDTNRYNVRKLAFYGGKDKDDNLITYADFNHNVTGQPLTCMNIHGGAGEELYNTLNARIQEAYRPCYIAGDFNAYIQHLDENLHDMELAYSGGTNTYIPWTAKTPNAGAPIDTILYTPSAPVKNTANNVAVFNGEVKDGHMQHNHRPSDHRPVISNFTPHKQ